MDPNGTVLPEETLVHPESETTIASGTIVQNTYQILSHLSQGGMGEVYKAKHQVANTLHAIKIIRPDLVNEPKSLALFKREAEVIRSIKHDSVVNYDGLLCDEDGRVYIIMEFIEGPTLRQFLHLHGRLTVSELLTLTNRLAEGISAFHTKGVVHRDLSPENIIIPDNCLENAKLIDFGIAKKIGPDAKTILGHQFAGKIAYAAPERLDMHEPTDIDGRSDLYSLGMVLLTAANGKQESRSVAEKILSQLPPTLSGLLCWMLERNPANRPQTASEIIDRIKSFDTEVNSADVHGKKFRFRNYFVAGMFLILAGILGYLWFQSDTLGSTTFSRWTGLNNPFNTKSKSIPPIESEQLTKVPKNVTDQSEPNAEEPHNDQISEQAEPEIESSLAEDVQVEKSESPDNTVPEIAESGEEDSTQSLPSDAATNDFNFQQSSAQNRKSFTPGTQSRPIDKNQLPLVNMLPSGNSNGN